MDRTVPSRASDEIALYVRTYYSLLRSSHEVRIKTLAEAHTRTHSALHVAAGAQQPDMAALIYSVLRLPSVMISPVELVVLGQSAKLFAQHGYPQVTSWQPVSQPARRRHCFFDGRRTLAVFIASRSDIDDLIPILTAYQIERGKLFLQLNRPQLIELLTARRGLTLNEDDLALLAKLTGVPVDDWDRLRRIWGSETAANLLTFATQKMDLSVRLLGGSLVDYRRATRQWWLNVEATLPQLSLSERPVYFVSSNSHSLANMLSGYPLLKEPDLIGFIQQEGGDSMLKQEYQDISQQNVPSNRENFLYYALKKYETSYEESWRERVACEERAGIFRVPSQGAYDLEVQIVLLNQLNPAQLDPRIRLPGSAYLPQSQAVIINIDFPLGMAAYQVLSEISRNVGEFRGVYIMGKAATLNGRIGDVMIPNVVHDEQSFNTYLLDNRFTAEHVAPYLVYGNVLDNQKSISVRGTFLQNDDYMAVFYQEGYTVMEMEAGPYLSSIYEMVRPQRYPYNELVNLYQAPFPIGILHYASDTPFSKGKNLGSQNLSYFGMDPTYATMVAILRAILGDEIAHLQAELPKEGTKEFMPQSTVTR